jgi:hypothetical protein
MAELIRHHDRLFASAIQSVRFPLAARKNNDAVALPNPRVSVVDVITHGRIREDPQSSALNALY